MALLVALLHGVLSTRPPDLAAADVAENAAAPFTAADRRPWPASEGARADLRSAAADDIFPGTRRIASRGATTDARGTNATASVVDRGVVASGTGPMHPGSPFAAVGLAEPSRRPGVPSPFPSAATTAFERAGCVACDSGAVVAAPGPAHEDIDASVAELAEPGSLVLVLLAAAVAGGSLVHRGRDRARSLRHRYAGCQCIGRRTGRCSLC